MPVQYERENLELLELLKDHSNNGVNESSGPIMRRFKTPNGEVIEAFPHDKSKEMLGEKIEIVEVVEAILQTEVGTDGVARSEKIDYKQIDLYSEEVLSEEILFQGRLNKF